MDWSGSVEKDKARNSDKPFLASQTHLECTDSMTNLKRTIVNLFKQIIDINVHDLDIFCFVTVFVYKVEEVHIFFDDKIIKLLSRLSSSRDKLLLN